MPAHRPRASFEPIPPDIDVSALVESSPNFKHVERVRCEWIDQWSLPEFGRKVRDQVVLLGEPLIIEGYHDLLDKNIFSAKWLGANHGSKVESVRDLTKQDDISMTIGHYLKHMSKLTEQFRESPDAYKDLTRQRIYLKDIDCPPVWHEHLREILPPQLFYLNENTTETGGESTATETAASDNTSKSSSIAGAGDLMSSLPPSMRAENLMCYIGHEGTYTPAHREMCATLGHNIMVEASVEQDENGHPVRPGSSLWFMTEKSDLPVVTEYWQSILGHNIEVENHFAQIEAWQAAPFTVYVAQQRPGDFLLIPPLAPHQVWNLGTRTMKVAWNRTTTETLMLAMSTALPQARMVCRDEQYKNKAIIYYTLQKYSALVANLEAQHDKASSQSQVKALLEPRRVRYLLRDFRRLFNLFREIILSEMLAVDNQERIGAQYLPFDSNVTCAYCRGNIFNRFLSCQNCDKILSDKDSEPYDVCMECYAMGRSCACISKLKWVEQFKWKELAQKYEVWRQQVLRYPGKLDQPPPLPLLAERERYTRKTLAQVCQEQLKKRPFHDPKAPPPPEPEDDIDSGDNESIAVDKDGTVKHSSKKKRRSAAWLKNRKACHFCCHRHELWKMAICTCGRGYCYGTLFRGMDLLPFDILQHPEWECPHCKGVCNAGACRKDSRQNPHEPNLTLLGADTRRFADPRSVESLVDFRVSNLNFLRETASAPNSYARLLRLQSEAQRAKQRNRDVDGDDEDAAEKVINSKQTYIEQFNRIHFLPAEELSDAESENPENQFIDPSLLTNEPTKTSTKKRKNRKKIPLDHSKNGENGAISFHDSLSPNQPVAPTAVMYQRPVNGENEHDNEIDETINDALGAMIHMDSMNGDGIKRTPVRKRKRDQPGVDSERAPTKQQQQKNEKQLIDAAKSHGRFFQASATLLGKSKIVKLKIGKENASLVWLTHEAYGATSRPLEANDQGWIGLVAEQGSFTSLATEEHGLENGPESGRNAPNSALNGVAHSEALQTHNPIGVDSTMSDEQMAEVLLTELNHISDRPDKGITVATQPSNSNIDPMLLNGVAESTASTTGVHEPAAQTPLATIERNSTEQGPSASTQTGDHNDKNQSKGDTEIVNTPIAPKSSDNTPNHSSGEQSSVRSSDVAPAALSKLSLPQTNGNSAHQPCSDSSDGERQSILTKRKGPGGRKVKIVSAAAKRKQAVAGPA